MPFPFEVSFDQVQGDLDTYVDEVFACLESEFLVMPKGPGFVEYPTFESGYEALKRATTDFQSVTSLTAGQGPGNTTTVTVPFRGYASLVRGERRESVSFRGPGRPDGIFDAVWQVVVERDSIHSPVLSRSRWNVRGIGGARGGKG